MRDYYGAWRKSSHRSVAVCNDCHTPPGIVGKYATKANNGFWHSYYFTTGGFPDYIQITARNRQIAEEACQKCHAAVTHAMAPGPRGLPSGCIRCHGSIGHQLRK